MNEQQRLYIIQARSDWSIFQRLGREPVCHRLLYLQMTAEKLAKAYLWRNTGTGAIGHAAFSRFIRSIATNKQVERGLGFADRPSFKEWIKDISDLAYQIERLAPALAGDGPNPEYPRPRSRPTHAPVEHRFAIWDRLQTKAGWGLWDLIQKFLDHFEAWC